MHTRLQIVPRISLTTLLAALIPFSASCSDSQAAIAEAPTHTNAATSAATLADPSIEAYRTELLDLAFEAASAFPIHPHIKNRSRTQEAVVLASLELDQPERALRYIERIDNWRRGKCYADLAYHEARQGRLADVQKYLDMAQRISDGAAVEVPESAGDSVEAPQEWRRDRIRTSIARTYMLLGQEEKAARVAEGAEASEIGRLHAEKAKQTEPADFEAQIVALDALVGTGAFEQLNASLQSYSLLFDRFYDDAERRAQIENKIDVAWAKLPIGVRIGVLVELAGHALSHHDSPKALELVDAGRTLLDSTRPDVESNVPLRAQLAALRFRSGDQGGARAEADAALAAYDAGRETVVNMYRGGVLRPLAEAYHAMGDDEKARSVYAKALEEGVVNPNSRPRAEDLAATATSMAVNAVKPDAALFARLKAIRAGLGDPW